MATTTPAADETAHIAHILAQRAKVREIRAVALSPSGKHLAWITFHAGKTTLMLADGDGHAAHAVTLADGCNQVGIDWAPAGDTLAVLTRCKVDPSNTKPIRGGIWLLDAAAGTAPKQLATLDGAASSLAWSPDGRRLDFLYVPGATRLPEATAAGNPRVGVIGAADTQVARIASLARTGGAVELLSPPELYVYEFDVSPKGDRLAYTAAPPPGDNNWWTAKLYTQAATTRATPRVAVDPATVRGSLRGLQMQQPTWSPDGRGIYFVGGLMSDRGADAGDLYRVAAAGGAPVNLTPGIKVTLHQFTFLAPRRLLLTQESLGHVQLAEYTLDGNRARTTRVLFTSAGVVSRVSVSAAPRRRIAYAASSFTEAPEVHAGALGTTVPPAVTTINAALKPAWGKARSLTWPSGGATVQGWLLYPANFDPHKTYPMIVYVHGGPTFANLSNWRASATAYSEFGYFVLMPNPRGSTGAGEKFVQGIRGQMGWGDLDDILAGVDAAEKIAPIDNARLGMTGWSYGGFMSMFAPTRTNRFKAVVAGAGIANWQSYYGQNQIDQWMIPFFGASVYADPAAYAKSSAINFITHAHTPALILVGERDEECPAPQSFEYWHALQTLGVPTTLVVYANQGHHIASHKDQIDVLRRSLDWFGRYLGAKSRGDAARSTKP